MRTMVFRSRKYFRNFFSFKNLRKRYGYIPSNGMAESLPTIFHLLRIEKRLIFLLHLAATRHARVGQSTKKPSKYFIKRRASRREKRWIA
jgi:hypothetical protein